MKGETRCVDGRLMRHEQQQRERQVALWGIMVGKYPEGEKT